MAYTDSLKRSGFGETMRRDTWWLQPAAIFIGFSTFIVYSTWAAFQNAHYTFGPYLSPFYSPELWGASPHAWFGPQPAWWPSWAPFSPALLILWAPGGFRFTCYYYRGAYYKAFWQDPPACSVGEPRKSYLGEHTFPLIMQNVHRFFFYLAVIFLVLLSKDAIEAFWFHDASGEGHFGIGVGSLVLTLNTVLLSCYAFGCHSLRHLIGGVMDRFSGKPVRYKAWQCVGCLNGRHMMFAWLSLFSVGFTDLYIRMCSMGIWTDFRLF
ncbi:hypothetical protein BH09SUM1_BH09SUM1_16710 [soil metagenome]